MKVDIKKSDRNDKKLMAVFTDDNNKKKTIHFGAKGMNDYTITGDKEARSRYRARTKKVYDKAEILWGDSKSVATNIRNYKKKYGFN
jgi:hypothetical protein